MQNNKIQNRNADKKRNIILVGSMGTGKSSVGRKLAEALQMDFFDADEEMAKVTGLDLMTLYWKCGKIRFQSEEELMFCKLLRKENSVIAAGGTLEQTEDRLKMIRKSGMLVCLKADKDRIGQRVNRKENRPLLRLDRESDKMQQYYENSQCWEEVADLTIDTTACSIGEIVQKISQAWECGADGIL